MTTTEFVALAATLFVWGLLSDRLGRWNISGPMVFVAVGLVLANQPLNLIDVSLGDETVKGLAEFTLAVVLFGDAAGVRLRALQRDAIIPSRLLVVGLPLCIVAGTVTSKLVFPALSWAVCALIASSVAPTDAALGAAIIEDERVPSRIRRVLNVESGLNDGIATPFVNLFLVAAVVGTSLETESEKGALEALAWGVLFGIAVGYGGGWLLRQARRLRLGATTYRPVAVCSLAIIAYAGTITIHGNGFVAAFVAGLAFGAVTHNDEVEESLEFTHGAAELLSAVVWFVFGALIVPVLRDSGWQDVLFALLALTVVRMLPVAIALIGSHFDRGTVSVIGWFGPRGLASVVFALLAVDTLDPQTGEEVMRIITATVVASVILHGITAAPIARRYGARHTDATL